MIRPHVTPAPSPTLSRTACSGGRLKRKIRGQIWSDPIFRGARLSILLLLAVCALNAWGHESKATGRLPTVGPAKAERIVTWRKKNGGFKRIADLCRVKGFGFKTFKRLEPFIDIFGYA